MDFYELIQKIAQAIPAEFVAYRHWADILLPWIFALCAAATCFFGHTVHKIWNRFFFFLLGFLLPYFIISLLLRPQGNWVWAVIILSAAAGAVCSYYSGKLFRVELFLTNFFSVYIAVPSALAFLGSSLSVTVGIALAVAAGILSLRYKYILLIITTSFSGASMLCGMLETHFALPRLPMAAAAVIIGCAGLFVQYLIDRKEIQETIEHLKAAGKRLRKSQN